jgi:hypothetical protein
MYAGDPPAYDHPIHHGLGLAQKPDVEELAAGSPVVMLDLAGQIERRPLGETPAVRQRPLQAAPRVARWSRGMLDQGQATSRNEGHSATVDVVAILFDYK